MKKIMVAVAGAMALAGSAFADAALWFDGGIAEGWPTATSMFGGVWTNAEDSAFADSAVNVSADYSAPLEFLANTPKTLGSGIQSVEIATSAAFTPFEELPKVPEDAKSAVIAVTNALQGTLTFYVLAKDGEANAWTNTAIAATEQMTAVKIRMTDDGKVTYTIGGQPFTVDVVMSGEISAAGYAGDGLVESLAASYEAAPVTFTIADVANMTFVVSNNNQQLTAPFKAIAGSDVIVTYKANAGYLFENGSDTKQVVVQAADGELETGVTAEDLEEAEAKIGSTYYLTVNEALDAVTAGGTITLVADSATTNYYEVTVAGVTIDLAKNTLSLGGTLDVAKGATLTLVNGTVEASTKLSFILRSYGPLLVLNGVTLDATNLMEQKAGRDRYTGAILAPGGDVKLGEGTEIVNVPDGLYAIAFENYAQADYTPGTLDFGTATVEGDILIGNGTVTNANVATFDEDARFDICAAQYGYATLATFAGAGFEAMTGAFPTATTNRSYAIYVTGQAYLTFDEAAAVTNEVGLLADCEGDVVLAELGDVFKLAKNGYAFADANVTTTAENAKIEVTTEGDVTVYTVVENTGDEPVVPGEPQVIEADTLEEAQAKAAQMTVKLDDDATAAAGAQAATVAAMLKVTAVESSLVPGIFVTEVTFKDEATNTVAAAATVIETAIATQNADLAADEITVTLDGAAGVVPGLYYGIVAVDDLGALATTVPAEWELATTDGVTLSAEKPSETKGFYRVVCSPAPKGQVSE